MDKSDKCIFIALEGITDKAVVGVDKGVMKQGGGGLRRELQTRMKLAVDNS